MRMSGDDQQVSQRMVFPHQASTRTLVEEWVCGDIMMIHGSPFSRLLVHAEYTIRANQAFCSEFALSSV